MEEAARRAEEAARMAGDAALMDDDSFRGDESGDDDSISGDRNMGGSVLQWEFSDSTADFAPAPARSIRARPTSASSAYESYIFQLIKDTLNSPEARELPVSPPNTSTPWRVAHLIRDQRFPEVLMRLGTTAANIPSGHRQMAIAYHHLFLAVEDLSHIVNAKTFQISTNDNLRLDNTTRCVAFLRETSYIHCGSYLRFRDFCVKGR